jgi:hypothetical protein
LVDLRADSVWSGYEGLARYKRLAGDGFEWVQITDDSDPLLGAPIPHFGLDRINTPGEADAVVTKHAARGDLCMTVHAGWGIEEDNEVFFLVEAILKASAKHKIPVFIETHEPPSLWTFGGRSGSPESFPRFSSMGTSATTIAVRN